MIGLPQTEGEASEPRQEKPSPVRLAATVIWFQKYDHFWQCQVGDTSAESSK